MSAAAPRQAPSAAPTTITPSVCPVMGTGQSGIETCASSGDEGGAGEDETGVDGERAGADDGRAMTSARTRRAGDGGDGGHGAPWAVRFDAVHQ